MAKMVASPAGRGGLIRVKIGRIRKQSMVRIDVSLKARSEGQMCIGSTLYMDGLAAKGIGQDGTWMDMSVL
jgi:hypothetical protein